MSLPESIEQSMAEFWKRVALSLHPGDDVITPEDKQEYYRQDTASKIRDRVNGAIPCKRSGIPEPTVMYILADMPMFGKVRLIVGADEEGTVYCVTDRCKKGEKPHRGRVIRKFKDDHLLDLYLYAVVRCHPKERWHKFINEDDEFYDPINLFEFKASEAENLYRARRKPLYNLDEE